MPKKRKGFKKPPPKAPAGTEQKAMTPSGDPAAPAQVTAPAMTDEARMNARYGGGED